jgi:predicted RNA-binding protein with TRAM domain
VSTNPNTGQVYITVYGNSLATIRYGTTVQPTSTTITINSVDSSNNSPLNGYYATLSENGAVTKTGFTPVPFTVTIGQTYTVEVQDFGVYYFSHWSDNGSAGRDRTFTATTSSPLTFTAVYSTTSTSSSSGGSGGGENGGGGGVISTNNTGISQIIVNSQATDGNPIDGYYTVLSQNGATINNGFTPVTFATNAGQTYTIEVQDFGNYYFNHWSDTGSTSRDRTITSTSSAQSFTAVYSTSQSSRGGGGSGNGGGSSSDGVQSAISVTTVNSSGDPITGYYISIWQNTTQIDSAFSPASLAVNSGQTFEVAYQTMAIMYSITGPMVQLTDSILSLPVQELLLR